MFGVALAQSIEPLIPDTLASLIFQQITRREEAMPQAAPVVAMRPSRARAWQVLAAGLWKLRREEAMVGGSDNNLPWDTLDSPQSAVEVFRSMLATPLPGRTFGYLQPHPGRLHSHVGAESEPAVTLTEYDEAAAPLLELSEASHSR